MTDLYQDKNSQEQLAHEEIQACRKRIKELRKLKCITIILEDGDFDDTLFRWDDLSDEENVDKIKEYYEKCICLVKEFNTDLEVMFEYADLLRFNGEYKEAIELFMTLETFYRMNGASNWEYLSLYHRMETCFEKTDGEISSLPWSRKVLEFSLVLDEGDPDDKLNIVSISLLRLVDLDWKNKSLAEDYRLFQQTLVLIKQMSDDTQAAANELESIATCYIAICEAIQNGIENVQTLQNALELIRTISEDQPDLKWSRELSVCCNRLENILETKRPYLCP